MRSPFKSSPNPLLMLTTPELLNSLEKIRFMIEDRQGLAMILADNGMGKTSLLRYLLAEYAADDYTAAMLNHTEFPSPYALLKAICEEFGVEPKRSQALQHRALEEWLINEFKAGRTVIVFIDEGQRLDNEQLEIIRSLLNFETYEDKLLQIVMAGTLDLRKKILAKRNKALHSRVFAPCLLVPLKEPEVVEMIRFRCERAGVANIFTAEACTRVFQLSGGVPRLAVKICAVAWAAAQRRKAPAIKPEMISLAYAESVMADAAEESRAANVA